MAQSPVAETCDGDLPYWQKIALKVPKLDYDEIPFESEFEKCKAKELESYLIENHNFDKKLLIPFEMAIFCLGNNFNIEAACKQYLLFVKYCKDWKLGDINKTSLLKSMTLLSDVYFLGGSINCDNLSHDDKNNDDDDTNDTNDNNDNNDNNGNGNNKKKGQCTIIASLSRNVIPREFDGGASQMVKGLYYAWNYWNYCKKLGLSRHGNYTIICTDLSGLRMHNFSLSFHNAGTYLLQYVYPMKTDTVYMSDAPFLMSGVIGIVTNLIDTKNIKLKQLNKNCVVKEIGHKSQVPMRFGGGGTFDSTIYASQYDPKQKTNNNNNNDNDDDTNNNNKTMDTQIESNNMQDTTITSASSASSASSIDVISINESGSVRC